MTKGYNLPAKYVIHTVGPIWHGGSGDEDALLARCYERAFALAREKGLESIAFPSISTGAYGFPVDRAARIALRGIKAGLAGNPRLRKVVVVCFDQRTYQTYLEAFEEPGK
jgi:O-acetyl-ADP-ribose deacetylase (regulator of RNase III)